MSHDDLSVWVVNPDSGSVTVIDNNTLSKTAEISVGKEPWALAIAPDGKKVYVVNRADGELIVIDTATKSVVKSITVGSEPSSVVLNPSGSLAYVALSTAEEIAVVDIECGYVVSRIQVDKLPYGLAMTDDGDADDSDELLYVTHLLAFPEPDAIEATDDGRNGHVTIIDTGIHTVTNQILLPPNEHGFSNLLFSMALTDTDAWIPHVRAAPALPNSLTTTLFAAVSTLDLTQKTESTNEFIPLNDQEIFGSPVNNPMATIPAPDGATLYIVLAGSDLVEIVDISSAEKPRLVKFLATSKNPRGMALNSSGTQGFVTNYLSRSITVIDLVRNESIEEVVVTNETLPEDVLQGKTLFNNASNPKLSQGSWISCASCHPHGGTDNVTWMFPDGPRQTPPLWNATKTLPWHWSAALDEPQDVEQTIQDIQHGLGLAPGRDHPQLGSPNAGHSDDLDALAAFMAKGIRTPKLLSSNKDVSAGRNLFKSLRCDECHGGATWTSSTMSGDAGTLDSDGNGMVDEVLKNVGTYNPDDIRGQSGFDPPSLLNVGLTAPYFHDGSMSSLEALLISGHPDPDNNDNELSAEEISALTAFLQSIDESTTPIIESSNQLNMQQ